MPIKFYPSPRSPQLSSPCLIISKSLPPSYFSLSLSISFIFFHLLSFIFLSHSYITHSTGHNNSILISGTPTDVTPSRAAGSAISSPSQRELAFAGNDTFTPGRGSNGPAPGAGLGSGQGSHLRGLGAGLYSPITVSAGGGEIDIKKLEVLEEYQFSSW